MLVTGASGGVGTAAVKLAKSLGARVVALSRSEAKREKLRELGANFTFNSDDPKLVQKVKDALGGPVNLVVENLAGPFLQKSINMTGMYGRICVIGMLAGIKSEISVDTILFKRIHMIGIAVGSYTHKEAREAWEQIVKTLDGANRKPLIDKIYSFAQVPEAFAHLNKGPMGKILIEIDGK